MRDIYAAITDRFLEQLKQGVIPWQRPWLSAQSIVSRKPYQGINALTLGLSQFDSPFWMTFRQAKELGGTVKKGAKSSPVIFYKFLEKHDKEGRPILTPKGRQAVVPLIRWSNVFNLTQTEGIEAPNLPVSYDTLPALDRAEAIARDSDLCPVRHQGFAAAYSPKEDVIFMPPPNFFRSREDYYQTRFHESVHATGHETRLAREGIVNPIRFGSERYSKEELVAELGASFLCNEAGILDAVRFKNAAGYIQGWLEKLQDDPSLIVSAASQAQKASDLILGRGLVEEHESSMSIAPRPAMAESVSLYSTVVPSRTRGRSRR
jgi:antirestriction protein ArdC